MTELRTRVAAELEAPVAEEVREFAAEVAAKYGAASQAVLFYGSCLWSKQLDGLMLDFYLLVDDYGRAYGKRWLAAANRLIPPNVFYAEQGNLRAKYAVLTVDDFARLASARTRNVSVWARFAQPSALVWARDDAARDRVVAAVAQAAPALLAAARPLLPAKLDMRELWTRAFALTYDAELRSEKAGRGVTLYDTAPERYRDITGPALAAAGISARVAGETVELLNSADPAAGERQWARRRLEGKLLSAVRLIKASLTFDGGIDYLAWKITRHSGVEVAITPWQRRHPILAGLLLLPQLKRKGAVR
ncbi:hypothetical protein ACFOMD_12570 [Sphingoaurantiacus capsulatus]|uniref:Phosphatidate cytidylyltransferase n=1 Tax=Sphingoaurantiacus capsulatus TaxID=1771310 RepID=A0ABV7XBB7_9SPHN